MTAVKQRVGRVFRLESYLLDQELDSIIDSFVNQLEIPRFAEELKSFLRLYLFASYVKSSSTTGMKVYDMNYSDALSKQHDVPSRYKLISLFALNLIASHVVRRCDTLGKSLQSSVIGTLNLNWLTLDNLVLLIKALNVANFFIFLKDGTYLTLAERFLKLVPVVSEESNYNNIQLNRMQIDYKYREIVWRAIAEFLSTTLPLINVEQVKNKLLRVTRLYPDMKSDLKLSDKFRKEYTKCAICSKQPFNPYEIGCRHVFCYYCLHSRYLSDTSLGYHCTLCKYGTSQLSDVQRYRPLNLKDDKMIKT